jgi:hypothetical protein
MYRFLASTVQMETARLAQSVERETFTPLPKSGKQVSQGCGFDPRVGLTQCQREASAAVSFLSFFWWSVGDVVN